MVDVEHRRLTAFHDDDVSPVEGVVEHELGLGDVGAQPLDIGQEVVDDLLDAHRATVVDLDEEFVLLVERALDLLAQDRLVEDVLDADAQAPDLVHVRRTDAAPGRPDRALAEEALGHLVQSLVVGSDEVSVRRDPQLRGVGAARFEGVDLLEERLKVDDDAVADDGGDVGREDPRGKELELVLLTADDNCVTSVVPAVGLDDVVDAGAEDVGGLPFTFVAPLSADDNDCWHECFTSSERRGSLPPQSTCWS
ncbi:Uncharacterised protein [Mycobacteroides abscessus subsp. abscessus]|nr:Uncharacterised protein [Mycobacteroides abscessus subsp. abscessus]